MRVSLTTRNFSSLSTHIASLQSFALTKNLKQGQKTHTQILKTGLLTSPLSITSLINMYSKSHSISHALNIFQESVNIHNVFIYNSIISGLTINNMPVKAFELYKQMRMFSIVPDKFTFPCVIKACSSVYELVNVHGLLFKLELVFDMFICSALLHCYLRFGLVKDAVKVFDEMPERNDVVVWNAMINGFVGIGEVMESLRVFKRMGGEGVVGNEFTVTGVLSGLALAGDVMNGRLVHGFAVKMGFYGVGIEVKNALIDMYGKCREIEDAVKVFDGIGDEEKDIYSWNSIVVVHEQCGDHDGALRFLKGMIRCGFEPDLVTVAAAFPACSYLSALMHGKEIHGFMIRKGLDKACGTYTHNAVMDMYAKCGSMRECRLIFDGMEEKDLASWNILVMGYGMRGFGNEALDLFSRLCETGLKPDEVSFIGVLSACNHGGLLTQGLKFLEEMKPKYGVTPVIEHYACVVDMLGRAGRLSEALDLISSMAVAPNHVVWRSFLSACSLHGNADLAQVALQRVIELEPGHCGNYVLMSNIFGDAGRYEEVAELRHSMRKQDVKKSPGCSWIELSNVMHVFFTRDHTHPEEDSIYEELGSLYACLGEQGFGLDVMEGCF